MTTALEAICDELAVLRRRVHCLEQADAIIRLAYEPAVTQTTPAMRPLPRRSEARGRPPRKSRRSRNATQTEVMEYVIAHGPLNRRELVTALGGNPTMISQKLKRLLEEGEIGAEGPSGARRYRAPDVLGGGPTQASMSSPPERGVYPMYDAIIDLDGATTEQLGKQTRLPTSLVVEQGRRLVQLGLVQFTKVGGARVWTPTRPGIAGDAA
jgi:hypothetical protein